MKPGKIYNLNPYSSEKPAHPDALALTEQKKSLISREKQLEENLNRYKSIISRSQPVKVNNVENRVTTRKTVPSKVEAGDDERDHVVTDTTNTSHEIDPAGKYNAEASWRERSNAESMTQEIERELTEVRGRLVEVTAQLAKLESIIRTRESVRNYLKSQKYALALESIQGSRDILGSDYGTLKQEIGEAISDNIDGRLNSYRSSMDNKSTESEKVKIINGSFDDLTKVLNSNDSQLSKALIENQSKFEEIRANAVAKYKTEVKNYPNIEDWKSKVAFNDEAREIAEQELKNEALANKEDILNRVKKGIIEYVKMNGASGLKVHIKGDGSQRVSEMIQGANVSFIELRSVIEDVDKLVESLKGAQAAKEGLSDANSLKDLAEKLTPSYGGEKIKNGEFQDVDPMLLQATRAELKSIEATRKKQQVSGWIATFKKYKGVIAKIGGIGATAGAALALSTGNASTLGLGIGAGVGAVMPFAAALFGRAAWRNITGESAAENAKKSIDEALTVKQMKDSLVGSAGGDLWSRKELNAALGLNSDKINSNIEHMRQITGSYSQNLARI